MDSADAPLSGGSHQLLDAVGVALHGLLHVLQQLVALLLGVQFVRHPVRFGFRVVHPAHLAIVQPLITCKLVLHSGALLGDIRQLLLRVLPAVCIFTQLALRIRRVIYKGLLLLLCLLRGMLRLGGLHVRFAALPVCLGKLLVQRGIRLVALGVLLRDLGKFLLKLRAALVNRGKFLLLLLDLLLEFLYSLVEAAAALLRVGDLLRKLLPAVGVVHEVVFQHLNAGALLRKLSINRVTAAAESLKLRLEPLLLLGAGVNAVL